jgi:hypothetical protein
MGLTAGRAPGGPPARVDRRRIVLLLVLYGAAPWLGYQLLVARHVPAVTPLCLLAAIPALGIVVQWVRTRRLGVVAALSLAAILLGAAGALATGNPGFVLAHGSLLTGAIGLACLVSATGVAGLQPLPLLLLRARASGERERRLRSPHFGGLVRRLTVLWGVVLLGEALVRAVIAFTLPASAVLAISPFLLPTVVLSTAGLTAWALRRARAGGAR